MIRAFIGVLVVLILCGIVFFLFLRPAVPPPIPIPTPVVTLTIKDACPTQDFSLDATLPSCTFLGGKQITCLGDITDSLGTTPDKLVDSGQVDVIDKQAHLDWNQQGGFCSYSESKQDAAQYQKDHGCGGHCTSVKVWYDGQYQGEI